MPFTSATRRSLMAGAAISLLLAAGTARAQTGSAEGSPGDAMAAQLAEANNAGDITVTGQRQQYRGDVPLKELPQSVQVLTAAQLQDAGLTQLNTALDFASGISRQNNFGGLFDSFAVRGFVGDENTAANYLVNGFNSSRGYGGARDAANIERIEILKGPNSALFGRGEPGGTVNIITKKPQFDTAGGFTISTGSYKNVRAEGDFTTPVTDTLAVRVNGAYENGDTFRDFVTINKVTVTPSVLWKITPATTLTYELEYIKQKTPFDRGIATFNGNLKTVPISRFLGDPKDGDVTVKALGHQGQLQHNFGKDWSVLFGASYRDTGFTGFSSDAELVDARQPFYENGTILARQRRFRDYDTTYLVFRGEVSGKIYTGPLTHHVLLGADWDKYTLSVVQNRFRPAASANLLTAASTQAALNAAHAINVFNPVNLSQPVVGPFQDQDERQKSWGIYFQDQIDITEWFKVRAGGRYDHFQQDVAFNLTNTAITQTKTAFSPQAGLVLIPSEAISFYGSFGKGFRPNAGTDVNNQAFTPERTTSYEVGAKFSALQDAVTATGAWFTTKKSNVLTADPANAGFSRALGKAKSKGVEFDMTAVLPFDARLTVAYAYTDAKVAAAASDPNFGFVLNVGDPLINIPRNSGSVLLFKDFKVGDAQRFTLGTGVNYVGKRLGETGARLTNGNFFYLPEYTLVRLLAAYEPTEHLRISGEVTNLFDKRYYASSYSRLWVQPGTPRQFMVRVGYKL